MKVQVWKSGTFCFRWGQRDRQPKSGAISPKAGRMVKLGMVKFFKLSTCTNEKIGRLK